MKTKVISTLVFILITATALLASEKNVKIKVYGNCGMCETRIEKAAKTVDGVSEADWSKSSKMLKLTMSDDADVMEVHKAVAKVGHDTDKVKADDKVYNDLPGCCKYDRKEGKAHHHDCNTPCKHKKSDCDHK